MATKKKVKVPRKAASSVKRPQRTSAARAVTASRPKKDRQKTTTANGRSTPGQGTPLFKKVAFTMFPVTDATRARAFYEQVLGFKRGLASPDGVWTEYDLPLGGCLALFKHPVPELAMAPGGASIAFEVADLDALNEKLRAAGVTYLGEVVHGPHCRMSNILDSEGNRIVLHQINEG